jgi:hypothetical protein
MTIPDAQRKEEKRALTKERSMNRLALSVLAFALSLAVMAGCASETSEPEPQETQASAPPLAVPEPVAPQAGHICFPAKLPVCGPVPVVCEVDLWGCRRCFCQY